MLPKNMFAEMDLARMGNPIRI
ncbi:hypothetical protein F383_13473 [Gossypium arboreum]|uniref:Uncharacterized protein n=1 Tax=Gossypium arboreum TaxID=29729 RepID=A0A0B0N4C1_GOSAR|nr:hypothetical protein F383_32986 [Gossypium arboreum]KHG30333.1 hypothetical protein F383_13473 [Gossypium arboreum]